jgi:hypothetical protein
VTTGDDVAFVEFDDRENLLDEFDGDNVAVFSSMMVGKLRIIGERYSNGS